MKQCSRKKIASIALIFLATVTFVYFQPRAAVAWTSSAKTGIIIPLYTYPGSTWSAITTAKTTYPLVPITAVINPNSGPGMSSDPNYVSGIKSMQGAGVVVLGYIWTNYGKITIQRAENQIRNYWNWYHINGIFFDGMSNVNGWQHYYSTLTSFAKSLGMSITFGNPGTSTIAGYVGTVNSICVYENPGDPSTAAVQSAAFGGTYSKSNFGIIAYGSNLPDPAYLTAVSPYVGWVYFSDMSLPNPYGPLPSYFMGEMALLNST